MSNLWVRSQNRETLISVNYVRYRELREGKGTGFPYAIEYAGVYLGEYETKERALEVLDEIQKLLVEGMFRNIPYEKEMEEYLKEYGTGAIVINNDNKTGIECVPRENIVYEMPEN